MFYKYKTYISSSLSLLALLAVWPLLNAEAQPILETKLNASDGYVDDWFGISVSLSGERALIGATQYYRWLPGTAYIFERQNNSWVEIARLDPSDGAAQDLFGSNVSLSGDRAFIGAGEDDDIGSVYVFEQQGGTWTEVAKLIPGDAAENDGFGGSISVYGNQVLIGSPRDDDNGSASGSVYVYERQNGLWTETDKLTASDGTENDGFGVSVSVSGDWALIGATGDDNSGSNSGSVYVFKRQNGSWIETEKLTASDGGALDNFGRVSISDNIAVIGASSDDDNGAGSGSAYIFELQGGEWQEVAKLTASDGTKDAHFGNSVSIVSERVLVGTLWDDANGPFAGAAYVFERRGGVWMEVLKLTAYDIGSYFWYGESVSLSGNQALIGAIGNEDNGWDAGAAYVYDLDPPVDYRIEVLSTEVDDLHAEGLLESRQHGQLSGLLYQGLTSYNGGFLNNAIKNMQQFVDFATQLLALNRLPDEDAQSLFDQGQAVIDKIEEEAGSAGKTESSITETLLQDLPQTFVLHQNHPNPFNPSTSIRFALPEQASVRLMVYDMLGREVERLVDGLRDAGNHEVTFDASGLSSGTYLYRLETPVGSFTQRMLLLK